MYHNSKLSKFAFRTKTGLKWPFFAQTIPFFVLCFITNIYIWYIVGSGILGSERLQYFQIHKRYVTFLIMLFVYFSCQGRSFMLTASRSKTLSPKNYFKAMKSSRMNRIFVILAILMTSSSDDVIKFSNFEFCNSFTFIVWSYCEKIKCLSLTTLKLLLFTFWIFSVLSQFWRFWGF